MPTSVRQKFHALLDEFSGRPDVRRFLRGGFWRGFFSKYAEANLLHKKMLRVSSKLRCAGGKGSRKGAKGALRHAKAVTHLLRSQCNDAYWHGIFGGLYAPHLRTELWRELVRAETIADSLHHGVKPYQAMTRLDFDADGRRKSKLPRRNFAAVIKPSDGGTLAILDFRPSAVTLINSLQRRVETYHSKLQNAAQFAAKVASIHEQTLSKEPGLEKYLKYMIAGRETRFASCFLPRGKRTRTLKPCASKRALRSRAAITGSKMQPPERFNSVWKRPCAR